MLEPLVKLYPGVAQWPLELAWAYNLNSVARLLLAVALFGEGEHDGGLALHTEAMRTFDSTLATDPGNRSVQRYLDMSHMLRGNMLVTAARPQQARPLLKDLLASMQRSDSKKMDAQDFDRQRIHAEALV